MKPPTEIDSQRVASSSPRACSASRRREEDCVRLHHLKVILGEDELFKMLDELPRNFDSESLLALARFGLGKEKALAVMKLGLSASACELIARMICEQNDQVEARDQ